MTVKPLHRFTFYINLTIHFAGCFCVTLTWSESVLFFFILPEILYQFTQFYYCSLLFISAMLLLSPLLEQVGSRRYASELCS
jgi:hypothetical protein